MKTKIINSVLAIIVAVFAFSPLLNNRVEAAYTTCPPGWTQSPSSGVCLPPGGSTFGGVGQTAGGLIVNVINILLAISAAIAILFLIIGGFQYITSAGNEERAKSGRQTVVNALIGLAIIILSFAIVSIVNNTASCLGNGGISFTCF